MSPGTELAARLLCLQGFVVATNVYGCLCFVFFFLFFFSVLNVLSSFAIERADCVTSLRYCWRAAASVLFFVINVLCMYWSMVYVCVFGISWSYLFAF